jgi:hypothetical protein
MAKKSTRISSTNRAGAFSPESEVSVTDIHEATLQALCNLQRLGEARWKEGGVHEFRKSCGKDLVQQDNILEWCGGDHVTVPGAKGERLAFLLPPTSDTEFFPILGLDWKHGDGLTKPNGTVYLYLWPRVRPAKVGGKPAVLVYRYDHAEDHHNTPWNFAHVQICNDRFLYRDWIGIDSKVASRRIPRIPMPGVKHDLLGMICLLMISLYGPKSQELRAVWDPASARTSYDRGVPLPEQFAKWLA